MIAKICGCEERIKKFGYNFNGDSHILCKKKKDVIFSEIIAFVKLLKYEAPKDEVSLIQYEINALKLALDLIR